ncbi:Golgi transport complex subunit 3, partial [Quaeritorhiza haematococci]
MLREQIAPYDVNFVRKEEMLDFTGIQDVVSSLRKNTWAITSLTTGILNAATPRVKQNFTDSKQAVDTELKRICEDFILETARGCVEPVSAFLLKISAFRLRNEQKALNAREALSSQSFAQPAQVLQILDTFKETLTTRLSLATTKMASYLGDRTTEDVLIHVIKTNILDTYQSFYDV